MKSLISLIGPPGSGKGTQGRLLASHFDFTYRATGDLVRAARNNPLQNEFYGAIRARNDAGIPQPDEVINELLEPMRERRAKYEGKKDVVEKILLEGTERARKVVRQTMNAVRIAMKIDYF